MKKLIALFIALMLLLCAVATAESDFTLVGAWTATKVISTAANMEIDAADMGIDYSAVFYDDGACIFHMFTSDMEAANEFELTWTMDGDKVILAMGEDSVELTITERGLEWLISEETVLIFTPDEAVAEAPAA